MVAVLGDVSRGPDHHVAIALAVKPGALLRLEHVNQRYPARRTGEVLQVPGAFPLVYLRVVAPGRLHRGRHLDRVDVTRLDLGLHEAEQAATDVLDEHPQNPD